jgi:hypothetical protein
MSQIAGELLATNIVLFGIFLVLFAIFWNMK